MKRAVHHLFVHFVFISATFLSFNVKEWIIENDLLVHRLKVSTVIIVLIEFSEKCKIIISVQLYGKLLNLLLTG